MKKWFVLYYKQGYRCYDRLSLITDVFQPYYIEVKSRKNGIQISSQKKLCPGYIFIHVDLSIITARSILSIPGIITFLKFGHGFCEIPEAVINSLHGVTVITKDPVLKDEILKISLAKNREEREIIFLNFLKKHDTGGGTIDTKKPVL